MQADLPNALGEGARIAVVSAVGGVFTAGPTWLLAAHVIGAGRLKAQVLDRRAIRGDVAAARGRDEGARAVDEVTGRCGAGV